MKKLPVAAFVAAQQVSGESAAMDTHETWAKKAITTLLRRLYGLIDRGVRL